MQQHTLPPELLAFRAELLKERIYATFVLLAVLLTIDTTHTSPQRALAIVGGTAISLWAASLVATRMSHRIIMQKDETNQQELTLQLVRHRPILYAALFPLFVIILALLTVISVTMAVNIAIGSLVLLLVIWSLLSARALRAGKLITLLLAGVELGIGLLIIGIKIISSH